MIKPLTFLQKHKSDYIFFMKQLKQDPFVTPVTVTAVTEGQMDFSVNYLY